MRIAELITGACHVLPLVLIVSSQIWGLCQVVTLTALEPHISGLTISPVSRHNSNLVVCQTDVARLPSWRYFDGLQSLAQLKARPKTPRRLRSERLRVLQVLELIGLTYLLVSEGRSQKDEDRMGILDVPGVLPIKNSGAIYAVAY